MKKKVVITGMGVISPLGNDIDTFWKNIQEGKCGIDRITHFDPSRLDAKIAGEVKNFDPTQYMDKKDARKMALFTQYAVAAAVQAWRDSGLKDGDFNPDTTGVILG
ncbi:MAG TPA: beta-ketoacyl synthase N-terminal-like domain-containing protein, partial [Spirochaetales bacterium]|nr:beta-ketoacyl synthase N-terminal-like domain-containing protein [Spirochaetales bacterium]